MRIGDLDFSDFPREINLVHGIDGEREYYEFWKRNKGIVIQRSTKTSPFYIFFIEGEAVRTYKTPDIRAYNSMEEAIRDLERLGFKISILGGLMVSDGFR